MVGVRSVSRHGVVIRVFLRMPRPETNQVESIASRSGCPCMVPAVGFLPKYQPREAVKTMSGAWWRAVESIEGTQSMERANDTTASGYFESFMTGNQACSSCSRARNSVEA